MDSSKNNIAFTLAYDCIFNSQTVSVSLYKIVYLDEKIIYNISYTDGDKQYICPTGSIESRIGNYRNGMIDLQSFYIFLSKNGDDIMILFDYILSYVKSKEGERKFDFEVEHINPDPGQKPKKSDIAMYSYAIALFTFYYNYLSTDIITDFNPDYKRIMLTYQDEDKAIFKQIKKDKNVDKLYFACTGTLTTKHKIGQKLTMLTLLESQNLFDPNSMLWKELYIQFKLSDLIVNGISNGFALISSWFIIDKSKDTHKLFDGALQINRIRNSKLAESIVDVLSEAKLQMQEIDKEVGHYYRQINNNMYVLDERIDDDIDYAKENIILSNVVLITIMQDLGNTFFNTIVNTKNMFSKGNAHEFDKYMFELCYNLYCLNTKVYTIHGDLHLKNLIISDTCETDKKIVFQLEDEKYVFPNTNKKHLCIIDFGHAICNAEYVNSFRRVHNRDMFLTSQIDSLLSYLYYINPVYKQYNDVFRKKIEYHYWAFFKILTALDVHSVTSNLLTLIKKHKSIGSISRDASDLIRDINESCNYYVINVVELLLNMNINDYSTVEEIEWPNMYIIKKHFAKYKSVDASTVDKDANIINYNKKITHSLYKQTQFPPKLTKQATKEQTRQRKKYDTDTEMMFGSIR